MSRRSSDSQDTVVNSEEINYPKIQNDLDDWKLPRCLIKKFIRNEPLSFSQIIPSRPLKCQSA